MPVVDRSPPWLLLGTRNTLYGLRLASALDVRGPRRLVTAHGVIDETTAMATAAPTTASLRLAFAVTGVTLFGCWNLTTLAGALGSELLAAPTALDAVVPAALLALLWPRLRRGDRPRVSAWRERRVAAGGAVIALALTPVVAPGVQVVLAAAAIGLGGGLGLGGLGRRT